MLMRYFVQLVLFLIVWLPSDIYSQPVAQFTANQTSGCGNVLVQFVNQSIGDGVLTYVWDFGNGNTSTATNPTTVYSTVGIYTVTLTVSDGLETDQIVATNYIRVFPLPQVNLVASPLEGCKPLNVNFTNTSTSQGSSVQNTIWDLGDGTILSTSNLQVSHVYQQAGNYTVTMVVTDENNCQQTRVFSNLVSANNNTPEVAFSATDTTFCSLPYQTQFINQSQTVGSVNYLWNFGDGTTSAQTNPTHQYESPGNYTVTLTATYPSGCSDALSKLEFIKIIDQNTPYFTVNKTEACANEQLTFNNTSSNIASITLWDFGDGNSDTGSIVTHEYQNFGTYTVRMINIFGGGCQDTLIRTNYIFISESPTANFSSNTIGACSAPLTVNYTNLSTGLAPLTYQWNFFPGGSTQQNPVRNYNSNGAFDTRLIVTNALGCKDTLRLNDYIVIENPTASFTALQATTCLPSQVNFTNTSLSTLPISTYQWNFGDGNISSISNPNHTYTSQGSYTPSLTITNSLGCTSTFSLPTQIVSAPVPNTNFSTVNTTVCAGNATPFNNASTNGLTWQWLLDGVASSTQQNPSFTFTDTGLISVTLIAGNNGCFDTLTRQDYVEVNGPLNVFSIVRDCNNPFQIQFNDNSIGETSYFWNFGDGTTSNLEDVSHTYSVPGTYVVTHTVSSNITGCSYTRTQNLVIGNLSTTFQAISATTGCAPLSVNFQLNGSGITGRTWLFGDGAVATTGNSPLHTYTQPGIYTVTLIVRYGNCRDTIVQPDYIVVSGPVTQFSFDTTQRCDSITAFFNNLTTSVSPITSYYWDFGDSSSSSAQNPIHSYFTSGVYPISLTVNDIAGCSVEYNDTIEVQINSIEQPSFSVDDSLPCPGQAIVFTVDSSAGDNLIYEWTFGDGSTSNTGVSTHTYNSVGNYSVSLIVTNEAECRSERSIENYIQISVPEVSFSVFPETVNCPPLLATFTPTTNGDISSYFWDFGDNTFSELESPGNLYTESGFFTVILTVTDTNNCQSTTQLDSAVKINGPFGNFSINPQTTGCPPFEVTFTPNAFNTDTYIWDFGDGTTGSGEIVTHTYSDTGNYTPTVIFTNSVTGCSSTVPFTHPIQVEVLSVNAGPDLTICQGQTVELNVNEGDTYTWFPNTALDNDTVQNPKATPDSSINYVISLTQGACSNSDTIFVLVNQLPSADFSVEPVCLGDTSIFINLTENSNGLGVTFDWNFEFLGTSDIEEPTFLFSEEGSYRVRLIVLSANGCLDTVFHPAIVYPMPVLDISVSNGCIGESTSFSANDTVSIGEVMSYTWQFGDGNTSTLQNPIHTYQTSDTFQVILELESNFGCSISDSISVILRPKPSAFFQAENQCVGLTSSFTDSSTVDFGNIENWNWTFGNGITSENQNPSIVYEAPGNYTVQLIVATDEGCSDTLIDSLIIYPLPEILTVQSIETSCINPVNVVFTASGNNDGINNWYVNDILESTQSMAEITFDTIGTYAIRFEAISSNGCIVEDSSLFQVYPTPIALFSFGPEVGCEPLLVSFNNNSINALTYEWTFGNGETNSDTAVQQFFSNSGTYSNSLIVEGLGGCRDTLTLSNSLQVLPKPTALFSYNVQTEPVADGTVIFTNQSVGQVSSIWRYGAGVLSESDSSFTYQFSQWGEYPIFLVVTSENGCTDSITTTVNVEFFGNLFVPNALQWNGEGEYGLFLPKGSGIRSYSLTIWDNWGNIIFKSDKLINGSPAEGWDGSLNGKPVPQDTYTWRIEAVFESNEYWVGRPNRKNNFTDTGTVTVIR